MKDIILSEDLKVSSKGKTSVIEYRAVLIMHPARKATVSIQQNVNGNWSVCGRWQLSTLLYGYPRCLGHKPSDKLSIDHGQQWQVDKGMHAALSVAIEHI